MAREGKGVCKVKNIKKKMGLRMVRRKKRKQGRRLRRNVYLLIKKMLHL